MTLNKFKLKNDSKISWNAFLKMFYLYCKTFDRSKKRFFLGKTFSKNHILYFRKMLRFLNVNVMKKYYDVYYFRDENLIILNPINADSKKEAYEAVFEESNPDIDYIDSSALEDVNSLTKEDTINVFTAVVNIDDVAPILLNGCMYFLVLL